MSRIPEKSKEILEKEVIVCEKALSRGFKKGVKFISASGSGLEGLVQGNLKMKWVDDPEDEDHQFNGDIVSTNGHGLIYWEEEKRWARIIETE